MANFFNNSKGYSSPQRVPPPPPPTFDFNDPESFANGEQNTRRRAPSNGASLLNMALSHDTFINQKSSSSISQRKSSVSQRKSSISRLGELDWRGSTEEPTSWLEMAKQLDDEKGVRLSNTTIPIEPPREWGYEQAQTGVSAMNLFQSYEKTVLTNFFLRHENLRHRIYEIDSILDEFGDNANALFEMLEEDFGEPVVPGKTLVRKKAPPPPDETQNPTNHLLASKFGVKRLKEKRNSRSIFDKLTDTKQYTGTHAHRFDKKGVGRGMAGRDRLHAGVGTTGHYGDSDVFDGNTNQLKKRTASAGDSGLMDASQFLTRQF